MQAIPTSWATWPEVRKDPDRIPLLVGMLDDSSPSVRSSAASALSHSAGDARHAKGRLLGLLADDADYGAGEYVGALLSIRVAAEEMGPLLVRKLASADAKARIAGCDGLERLGPAAGPWKEALRERLEDADPRVRGAAKSLLARLPDR